jgi:hypothetical protein
MGVCTLLYCSIGSQLTGGGAAGAVGPTGRQVIGQSNSDRLIHIIYTIKPYESKGKNDILTSWDPG